MERLSERLKSVAKLVEDGVSIGDSVALTEDCVKILQDAAQRLAHYEDLELTPEEIQHTLKNFSAFLCEVTGNRMSKTNYTVKAMVTEVYDYFERMCDDCYDRKEYAHYEDLAEQGRLVELPCAVGDTVWFKTYERNATVYKGILPHKIEGYRLCLLVKGTADTVELPDYAFGSSVFLSKEEAEAALAASRKKR